eukprot:TRINITY_DN23554_c0_g2_i2.p1 TRINITY_DN23554_c0_g2~~TRINITY_DN23554_c0_g2_i2.p1  ORF type:complete len:651 (-),score=42.76 TRINITY_DN23554_c0_g2_i2:108-2060(-)
MLIVRTAMPILNGNVDRFSVVSLACMLTCLSEFLVWGVRHIKKARRSCDTSASNRSVTWGGSPRLNEVEILWRWNGVIDGNTEIEQFGTEGALNQGLFAVSLLPWCTPENPDGSMATAVVKAVGPSERSELQVHEELSRRNHPNIMPIYDKVDMGESLGVMMANAVGGTLQKAFPLESHFTALGSFADHSGRKFVTASSKPKSKDLLKLHASRIALDFSRGLTSMHHKLVGYVHGDLKPDNVMASGHDCLPPSLKSKDVKKAETNKCVFMLIDFGLTTHSNDSDTLSGCYGTTAYFPPEANCMGDSTDLRFQHKISWDLLGSDYQSHVKPMGWSKEGDLFAMGLTILSAITGLDPSQMMFEYGNVTVLDVNRTPVTIVSVRKVSISSGFEDVTDLVDATGQLAVVLKDALRGGLAPVCKEFVAALRGADTDPPDCDLLSRQYVNDWAEAQRMKGRSVRKKLAPILKTRVLQRSCRTIEKRAEQLYGSQAMGLNCKAGLAQYTINWALNKVADILSIPVRELHFVYDKDHTLVAFYRTLAAELPIFKWLGEDMATFLQRTLALDPRDRLDAFKLSSIATKAYKSITGRTRNDPDPRFERCPTPACIKDCSACPHNQQCFVEARKVSCEQERMVDTEDSAANTKQAKKGNKE